MMVDSSESLDTVLEYTRSVTAENSLKLYRSLAAVSKVVCPGSDKPCHHVHNNPFCCLWNDDLCL